jgi:hypothetical protein
MIYEKKSDTDAKIIIRKILTQKKVWTFKCFKMYLIFKSPYHIHLIMDFNFIFSLTCMLKSYVVGFYSHNLYYLINHI